MSRDPDKPGDDEIINRILDGRVDDFETLLLKYGPLVQTIVKRHVPPGEVEDTAQEAFIRAYQSLPTYRGRGGGFKPWLSAVAVRTCYDYWRNSYRSRETPLSAITEEHLKWLETVLVAESRQALLEKGALDEARELLDWALARLSAEDRMVIELVYLEGLSGKEAAELLGWSLANVKVRSFRARKKLESILKRLMKRPGEAI
jgi:RNA polymerase sigma-70 factor (ECF subfamily)